MKKILLAAALAGVAVGGWQWHRSSGEVDTTETKLVRDRIWIDHMPRSERETVNGFVALSDEPVGVFQAASVWKGSYELFRYEMSGDQLQLIFPQNGERERVRVKARRCKEAGMDFCMEMDGASRGVKKYYSREGWEIGSLDAARAKLDAIEHQAAR